VTYPYDKAGLSGSTNTTSRATRTYDYDAPYHSGPKTMPERASKSPTQPLIDPGLENREYKYLPFGGTYSPTTTVSLAQRYTYTGREKNPTSDLMYYRYRQYDPRVGRFGARDPLGYAEASPVLYDYADGGPSVGVDPNGLATLKYFVSAAEPPRTETGCGADFSLTYNNKTEFCCCDKIAWRQYVSTTTIWHRATMFSRGYKIIDNPRHLDGGKWYSYQDTRTHGSTTTVSMEDSPGLSTTYSRTTWTRNWLVMLSQVFHTQLICVEKGTEHIVDEHHWWNIYQLSPLEAGGTPTHHFGPRSTVRPAKDPCVGQGGSGSSS